MVFGEFFAQGVAVDAEHLRGQRLVAARLGQHHFEHRLLDALQYHVIDRGRFFPIKVARKHISWYTKGLVGSAAFRKEMNTLPSIEQQMQAVNDFFQRFAEEYKHLKYDKEEALAA